MTFPRLTGSVLSLLVLATFLGCDSAEDAPYETLTWDSAGVTVVENRVSLSDLGTFAEFDPTPLVEIGVESGNGAQEFGRISEARLVGEGRILIADSQGRVIREFALHGSLVWSFGRGGEGPWEFRGLSEVEVTEGDSVRVFDRSNRRITVIDPDGQPIRTTPVEPVREKSPSSLQFTATGLLILPLSAPSNNPPMSSELELTRDSLVLLLVDPEVGQLAEFGTFLRSEALQTSSQQGGMYQVFSMPIQFGRSTDWASARDRVFIGTNDSFEILAFDNSGTLKRVIRVPSLTLPLTDEEIEHQRAFLISDRGSTPEAHRRADEMLSRDLLPPVRPAFSQLMHDGDGRLWVGEYSPRPEVRSLWYVFRETGELLGSVRLPPGSVLHDVAGDLVLIQPPHPLDIPIVRVHELLVGEH